MAAVNLTTEQTALVSMLRSDLERAHRLLRSQERPSKPGEVQEIIARMGELAHRLHLSLRESGHTPVHHKYMLVNREVPPEDPAFYAHIHPVEDLLKFVDNTEANRDPEDQTIDHDFNFPVYSRRWGHKDHYRLRRTRSGWTIGHLSGESECDPQGRPLGTNQGIAEILDHESIDYPDRLGEWLEWVWHSAKEKGLSHEQVQQALDQLAEWVSRVEESSPQGGIWAGYK